LRCESAGCVHARIGLRVFYQPSHAAKIGNGCAYPKRIYYNKFDKGGHFAAWEQPGLFASEVCAAFRRLRSATYQDEAAREGSARRLPEVHSRCFAKRAEH
jgi:hypothetical protein